MEVWYINCDDKDGRKSRSGGDCQWFSLDIFDLMYVLVMSSVLLDIWVWNSEERSWLEIGIYIYLYIYLDHKATSAGLYPHTS